MRKKLPMNIHQKPQKVNLSPISAFHKFWSLVTRAEHFIKKYTVDAGKEAEFKARLLGDKILDAYMDHVEPILSPRKVERLYVFSVTPPGTVRVFTAHEALANILCSPQDYFGFSEILKSGEYVEIRQAAIREMNEHTIKPSASSKKRIGSRQVNDNNQDRVHANVEVSRAIIRILNHHREGLSGDELMRELENEALLIKSGKHEHKRQTISKAIAHLRKEGHTIRSRPYRLLVDAPNLPNK